MPDPCRHVASQHVEAMIMGEVTEGGVALFVVCALIIIVLLIIKKRGDS